MSLKSICLNYPGILKTENPIICLNIVMNYPIDFYSEKLKSGSTILYPTDTIWGLGCDAFNQNAVDKIYKIKQRDKNKPCILLVESVVQLKKYVKDIHPRIENLLDYYYKPITIIYEANETLHDYLKNSNGTVAIRLVRHVFCQQLIKQLDAPILSTSANIQGKPFPQKFEDICDSVKRQVDVIVDRKYEEDTFTNPSIMVSYNSEGELQFIRS